MSYRFKGKKIIIDGKQNIIVPNPIPEIPDRGEFTIDPTDDKFKVYNEAEARWVILGDAKDQVFDNTTAQLPNNPQNTQDAIEAIKDCRFQYIQYQFIGLMDYDQYLITGAHLNTSSLLGSTRRSGDASSGYRYENSAPATAGFTGKVKNATACVRGLAVSTGNKASTITLKFELWKVGFTGQGTKLGDITFTITSSSYTIGTYYDASVVSSFTANQTQNVNVTAGDLLALKFDSRTGNSNIAAVQNTTIVLEIIGNTI